MSTRKMQIGCNGVDACSNALREAKPPKGREEDTRSLSLIFLFLFFYAAFPDRDRSLFS